MKQQSATYEAGYTDGRCGTLMQSEDSEYKRGWLDGECAREEAENGWNPILDGGQW